MAIEAPDFIEEQRLAEEERLRQEALAQTLNEPPPVWAGSSPAEIDAFNAQPGTMGSRTTIGSPQYMQELARAQSGSGYIAPDVGPTGNVITPAYDPNQDLRRIQAEENAMRYKGEQLYSSLVQGGATPAEAYRAAGHLLNFNSPEKQIRIDNMLNRAAFVPRSVSGEGVTFDELSPGRFSRRPPPVLPKMVRGAVPPAVRAQEKNIVGEIDSLRRQLTTRDPLTGLPIAPAQADALKQQIQSLEQQRVDLLNKPEYNPNIDQPGWLNMRDRFNAAGAAPAPPSNMTAPESTKVIVIKDGKRYRLPKSQLDEAIKDGYKLVE